jgi:hypothetical protein
MADPEEDYPVVYEARCHCGRFVKVEWLWRDCGGEGGVVSVTGTCTVHGEVKLRSGDYQVYWHSDLAGA